MKRFISSFIVAALCAAQSPEQRTGDALKLVLDRKYAAFYALFSPEMKKAISLQTYSAQMDQILAMGAPTRDAARMLIIADSTLVTIPLHWPAVSLNFLVSWNKDGQIQGTWLRPPEPGWQPPGYSHAGSFTSSEVTVGSDEWKLPGTLTMPKGSGPFPAVALVHGSGPNDRDETVGGARVFRDLAEGLASRGIAVLRYDKRTLVYKAKVIADPDFTMTRETVDDAVRAAELLRSTDRIDGRRIFVAGHSQGGYMMPRIMERAPWLAGAVIMAGNVRPLDEIIVEQSEYLANLGSLTAAQQAQVDALRKNPGLALASLPQKYRQDLDGYHPAAEAAALNVPMLILQGERDYQVTMKDFDLWKAALGERKNVTLRSYPNLNHLLEAGRGSSSPAEYEKPGHVAEQVVEDIAAWIVDTPL